MLMIKDILNTVYMSIIDFTTEEIALISIFVTFIIYTMGKSNELRMKKHEAKKEHYSKLIEFFEELFSSMDNKTKKPIKISNDKKKQFFEMGSSLLVYGSRRLYRQYIFFRELNNNPLIAYSKYYNEDITLYVLADMFKIVRKEIGLNKFNNISSVEALAFFVNNLDYNPDSKVHSYEARYKIRMLKFEMYFIDRINFIYVRKIFYLAIAPFFSLIKLILKYSLWLPFIKILIKINPDLDKKLDKLIVRLDSRRDNTKV